jgi:hypothetical protein
MKARMGWVSTSFGLGFLAGLMILLGARMDYVRHGDVATFCWVFGGVLVVLAWVVWRRSTG